MSLNRIILFTLVAGFSVFQSCSKVKLSATATESERMEAAIKLFEKGDYVEAKTQFRILTLSHSGSLIADKAQFYLAECHFNMKEYILAASEYERLIKVYPNSEYTDDAKFKLGLSYYRLSPHYGLDQEYTRQAIMHLQEFLEDYPASDLKAQVEQYLLEARNKLAQKVFSSAEIYRKMKYYESALIYYDKLMEEFYDTPYAAYALFWTADCHRVMKRYDQALEMFDLFIQKNPQHEWLGRARAKITQTRRDYERQLRHDARSNKPTDEGIGE